MSDIRTSLIFSFAERYFGHGLHIVVVIVLARLLTPEETGIYSVAVAITGIAHRLRDFGVSTYLIQAKELTAERLQTTFTVSCLIAFAIAGLLIIAREPVASFYREPEIRTLLAILAGSFLVIPFGAISLSLLRREMNFQATFCISIVVGIVYASVAIGLASQGFGPNAMAWASLAGAVAASVGALWFRPVLYSYIPTLRHWREVVRFGGYSTGANLAAEITLGAPDLIVSRALGFHAAGILSRASGLVSNFGQFVLSSIAPVALSALAQRLRENRPAKREFIAGMSYLTALAWPFYAVLAIMAAPAIDVLLGSQWHEAALPLRILCAGAAIAVFGSFNTVVLVAAGAVKRSFVVALIALALHSLLIGVSSPFGIVAVAMAIASANAMSVLLAFGTVCRLAGAGVAEVIAGTWKSVVVACATATGPLTVVVWTATGTQWGDLLLGMAEAALGWVAALFISRHPFAREMRALTLTGAQLFRLGSARFASAINE